jgi:hypothetical protein
MPLYFSIDDLAEVAKWFVIMLTEYAPQCGFEYFESYTIRIRMIQSHTMNITIFSSKGHHVAYLFYWIPKWYQVVLDSFI